jgi:hypothetical protein
MRRIALIVLTCTMMLVPGVPASAGDGIPLDRGLPVGEKMPVRFMRWGLGSSTNPVLQPGFCGEVRGDKFFLNAAAAPGTQHATCEIEAGMPIIAVPGAGFAWSPTDGQTDAELLEARDFFFSAVSDARVVLDGERLRVTGPVLTDVFDVTLHPGNFIAAVDPALEDADSTRVAAGLYITRVALSEGDHVLVIRDLIDTGDGPTLFRYRFEIEAV